MAKPALQLFIESQAGGPCQIRDTAVTVTTAPTRVVDHNFERMSLIMINTGTVDISIRPGLVASLTNGIILHASGGSVALNAKDDLALVGWEWSAIVAAGTTVVTVFEVIRFAPTQMPGGA